MAVDAGGSAPSSSPLPSSPLPTSSRAFSPPPPAYHIERDAPGIFLLLVSNDSGAAEALGRAKNAVFRALTESDALRDVMRAAHAAGPAGVGDYSAAAYAHVAPRVAHFVYVWKPWRQFTQSLPPEGFRDGVQRKALQRAYQRVYDRLLLTSPPLRHSVSSFSAIDGGGGGGGGGAGAGEAAIAHIAGLHTTNAILLAAFDAGIDQSKVPDAMERLAKAIKRDHDKLLLGTPATLA